jgi:hypothetical protein
VRLDDGPIAVGSSFRVVAVFLGNTVDLRYVITAFEPGVRVVFEASTARLHSLDEITVDARGDGTRVVYRSDLRFVGISRTLSPLLGLFFRRLASRAREGLERELNT